MEAGRCQIQPEKHSERLVMKVQALLIKTINVLRNNQSETNDEEDANKDDMPTTATYNNSSGQEVDLQEESVHLDLWLIK